MSSFFLKCIWSMGLVESTGLLTTTSPNICWIHLAGPESFSFVVSGTLEGEIFLLYPFLSMRRNVLLKIPSILGSLIPFISPPVGEWVVWLVSLGGEVGMSIPAPFFLIVMEGSLPSESMCSSPLYWGTPAWRGYDYEVLSVTEWVAARSLLLHTFPSYCCVANCPKT